MKRLFLLLLFILSVFNGCNESKEEIKIGFVAGLSGKYSSLGISIRDGFMLAFDEKNYTINGQKVKIIEKDDKQDKNEAKKAIDFFIKNNIKIVVGHATSSMTAVSFPIVNKQKDMLLFSATTSSSEFSKQDDNFIRIQVEPLIKGYQDLLDYLKNNNYKNIYLIYDSKNIKYVQGYTKTFQNLFIKNGGNRFVGEFDINNNYNKLLNDLTSKKYDLILVVANSIDSANAIQYLRHNNINTQVLASGWAKTMDFIAHGGKAVEGVLFATSYDEASTQKEFVDFVKKFKQKYNKTPSVFAAQGYELATILIENLEQSTDTSTLKQRILDKKIYKGLQGEIVFDKFGDIEREYFMMQIQNGKYTKLK